METIPEPQRVSMEELRANAAEIQGRLALGEIIEIGEVSPLTHPAEIVALAAQSRRRLRNGL